MAEYAAHGVDVMIDLNHETLESAIRPDSHDARGWCKLAVRNGELHAVDVRWTPDGDRRLREKTQRFVSPVAYLDKEHRALSVVNIALCAMPATDFAQPLVAACRAILARRALTATVSCNTMDPEKIKAVLEALKKDDGKAALALLEDMLAAAVGGGAAPAPESPAEPVAEAAAVPPVDPAAPKEGDAVKEYAALVASTVALATKQGVELVALRASVAALTANDAKADNVKRCGVVAELIALGVETPATAWEKDAKGEPDASKPVKRLAAESVEDMTARVVALSVGRPKRAAPPARGAEDLGQGSKEFQTSRGMVALSARELKACTDNGAKPEAYAENKAIREAARSGGSR